KRAHEHYIMSYANKIGQTLISSRKRKETIDMPSSNPEESLPFQSSVERKRIEDEEEQQQLITDGPMIIVPDHSDDEMISDETREECLDYVQIFVNCICEGMQTRVSKVQNAKIHEDSSQIKSSFRNISTLNTASNGWELVVKLVQHEIDLCARFINEQLPSADLRDSSETTAEADADLRDSETTTEADADETSTIANTNTCTEHIKLKIECIQEDK
ncbi:unnamed protein product, partial [Rotaria sordida]